MTLAVDARLLEALVADLDEDAQGPFTDETLHADLTAWKVIEDANRQLQLVRQQLTDRLGALMERERITVPGVAVFDAHVKKNRTKWEKDDLRRAVLDTRTFDDEGTLVEESPLDKVLAVFPLGNPRLLALRARGLEPEEWCETERAGWSIQVFD
ncbi:MAG TPA: hypothetical protein VK481_00405 [Gemmatimonadaceae bacterium]|nr:hypothetical protein [Gemmatimonadaceae bacterium]